MTLVDDVRAAVASVDDPEYPEVSIVDLGLVERVSVDRYGGAHVDLVPTFIGCPALEVIGADVQHAVESVAGVETATVRFVHEPVWSPARITERGRRLLAERFTVAVPSPTGAPAARTTCPRCGSTELVELSAFGPSPCRTIQRCSACREPVEVVRT